MTLDPGNLFREPGQVGHIEKAALGVARQIAQRITSDIVRTGGLVWFQFVERPLKLREGEWLTKSSLAVFTCTGLS